jgi:hypothetical protein
MKRFQESLRQGLFELLPELLGLFPEAGRGALADALMVEPALDPLGAVAPAVKAVTSELAIRCMTGENEGIHRGPPTSAVECCPNGEMGQNFGRLLIPATPLVTKGSQRGHKNHPYFQPELISV